jgi:CheY-like chemotaxis protein
MAETSLSGRVVIADDDAHTRFLLRELCEGWGFQAEPAEDGQEAIAKIDENTRLVILDLMMPKLDGFAVLEHLRQTPRQLGAMIIPTAIGDGRQATRHRAVATITPPSLSASSIQAWVRLVPDRQRYREYSRGLGRARYRWARAPREPPRLFALCRASSAKWPRRRRRFPAAAAMVGWSRFLLRYSTSTVRSSRRRTQLPR